MRDIEGDPSVSFYDPAGETLDRDAIRRLQEEKLCRLMIALENNPFYTAKLANAGKSASEVKTLRDLEQLPFTTKPELVAAQRAHPPFGDLLTYPLSRYRRLHGTSGTSGQPLLWLDSEEDWETWIRCWGHVYRGAGVSEEDVMFMAFSFGPYVSHWAAMAGSGAARSALPDRWRHELASAPSIDRGPSVDGCPLHSHLRRFISPSSPRPTESICRPPMSASPFTRASPARAFPT